MILIVIMWFGWSKERKGFEGFGIFVFPSFGRG
jgi:hypothetical protein